jgi:hypothetical protein
VNAITRKTLHVDWLGGVHISEEDTVVVKEVIVVIFFTTVIHFISHLFGEHVLNKMQKAFINEMTGLAKSNNLRVPRVERNAVIGMGIWIGIEISEEGV